MIMGFWDMTPCSFIDSYQHIRRTCGLHFEGTLKMKRVGFSKTLVAFDENAWYHIAEE
jgi:hypothetical protein